MALAYTIFSDGFGKWGIPLKIPNEWGGIPHFQLKLFPMEIFLLWVALITFARAKEWKRTAVLNSLTLLFLFVILFGLIRMTADLNDNPLLVIRNSAFIWYLFLPLAIALYPVSSIKWEVTFRLVYLATFLYVAACVAYSLFLGDPKKIFWSPDFGVLLAVAYGLCATNGKLYRLALAVIGLLLGLSYFSGIQRTTLTGIGITLIIVLVAGPFRSLKVPTPRWRRLGWAALGIAASISAMSLRSAHQREGENLLAGAAQAISEAKPGRVSEKNSIGLEKFRAYMWLDAWESFRTHPWAGIGFSRPVVHRVYLWKDEFVANTGSFEQLPAKLAATGPDSDSPPIAGPHNSYLNALARLGISGLGLLILHLACGWVFIRRKFYACFFVLLAQMLYAFFNVGLEGPIRSFPILLLIGVALKASIDQGQFRPVREPFHG